MSRSKMFCVTVWTAVGLAGCGAGENGTGSGGSVGTGTGGAGGPTGTGGGGVGGSTGTGGAGTGNGGTGTGGSGTGGETAAALPSLVTSGPGAYWNTTATLTTVTSGTVDITVNDTTTYQRFDGFGGAFNEQGWDNLQQLSASDQMKAITLLFDATNGAHFMYGRIPIGSSDYAMSRYTDDETSGDTSMTSFSITRDQQYLIPFVKAALGVNPQLHLWASPWTPPTWMKTGSGSVAGTSCAMMNGNTFDGGCMTAGTSNQNLTAFALYLSKWVTAYAGLGITVEAVHPQNEPNYATPYSSCLWTSALYDQFIASYLGPTFASNNPTTQIWLGTMSNNNSGTDPAIISAVTADKTAMKYVKGAGLQWNVMSSTASLASMGLTVMQTEHKCGNYPFTVTGENPPAEATNPNMAPNDQGYGMESWGLIRDWIKAGVNSYSAWNMVLDTLGGGNAVTRNPPWYQNALLVVNRSAKTLTVTPAYYVFRHLSQYIQPGATRVGTTGTSLDALAFKNPDGSIVTVMYNAGSAAKTAILSVAGSKLQFLIPSTGWATVKQ
jgi:glucosylceramidase